MSGSPRRDRAVARALVDTLGGRYSTEAGIDVDGGAHEIERWLLAATLFGTRISATVAVRTYRTLDAAGVSTIADAGHRSWDDLVALLDAGGYARYDFRTATRLLALAGSVEQRHPRGVAATGAACRHPDELEALLDALPGWGPVTIRAFLRELRGVWPAARPPVDPRTADAARHLRLGGRTFTVVTLRRLASDAQLDPRDLETALVRLGLAHHRGYERCVWDDDLVCGHLAARRRERLRRIRPEAGSTAAP